MIKLVDPKLKKSITLFIKHLLKYNRAYRIFTLLVWTIVFADINISLLDNLAIFIVGTLPCFFFTLFIIDPKFKAYIIKKRQQQLLARAKRAEKERLRDKENLEMFSTVIRILPTIILHKFLPYLTRLPILEDYFQSNLNHYKHRHIKQFVNILEGPSRSPKIQIRGASLNQYYATFLFTWAKPLNATRAKKILLKRITSFLGETPQGIIFRIKGKQGKLLIPIEIIQEKQTS